MYISCGDVDFFEYGVLVQNNRDNEYDIIFCRPIYDLSEELYYFGEVTVDLDNTWMDKSAVLDFIGMNNENYNEINFAIGCLEYYGAENFGTDFQNWQYTRNEIKDILKHRLIASDNLNIEW